MKKNLNITLIIIGLLLCMGSMALADGKPSFDLNWYGYVKLDASYDQNLTSHGNFAMWVNPKQAENDEQFNMTHKQTRFGFKAKGNGYNNVTVGGQLEFDLYGSGGTENKALLLLRHANLTVGTGSFQLLAGQSWDLISPLNPSTLNYPVMWGCGNIGYRRPQIRFTLNHNASDNASYKFATGFFRTIGSDLTPTLSLSTEVSDGSDDGTDAGIPSFQGLGEANYKLASGTKIRFGVSGVYGQYKSEGTLGTNTKYYSKGVMGHAMISFSSGFGISGEYFSGTNLGGYFGGIVNSNSIDGIKSSGGWGFAWFKASSKVKFGTGFGFDDPEDSDLTTGNRSKNQSYFANVKYSPIQLFTFGVEASQWETSYIDSEKSKAFRLQTSLVLNF